MVTTIVQVTLKRTLCFDTNHKIQINLKRMLIGVCLWLSSSQKIVATILNKTAKKLLETVIQLSLGTQCFAVHPVTEAGYGEGYGVVRNWQSCLRYPEHMEPTELNSLNSTV